MAEEIKEEPMESLEDYTSIEEQETPKKKSLKIPALIIGICMIIAGIVGIAITLPAFFN